MPLFQNDNFSKGIGDRSPITFPYRALLKVDVSQIMYPPLPSPRPTWKMFVLSLSVNERGGVVYNKLSLYHSLSNISQLSDKATSMI